MSTPTNQPRTPAGSPQGGQFAANPGGSEGTLQLRPNVWIRIEREHGLDVWVGPYPDENTAHDALDYSPLITELCEEDSLDCYTTSTPPADNAEHLIDTTMPTPGTAPAMPQPNPDTVHKLVNTSWVFNSGDSVLLSEASPVDTLAAARQLLGEHATFSHLKDGYAVYTRGKAHQ